MRIRQLLIAAYGPFLDCALDWQGAPLQIVFGSNEAGKSSALRALGDWRFGFPRRTSDNFRHANSQLMVAAQCATEDDEWVVLARYKRDKESLWASPLTADSEETARVWTALSSDTDSAPQWLRPAPEFDLTLAGALARGEYETMYGLDHARLRAGGEALIRGEGELGNALFAASAGAGSVQQILTGLEGAAGEWFKPRATTAPVNLARKSYLDSKRRVRDVELRPAEWRSLKQVQTAAAEQLDLAERDFEDARRRHVELSLLRSLAPQLARFDELSVERDTLRDLPRLPSDASQLRISAQTELEQARAGASRALEELEQLDNLLEELDVDEELLAAATPVERLRAELDAVARERQSITSRTLELETCSTELTQLFEGMTRAAGQTRRTLPGLGDADEAALLQHLDAVDTLEPDLRSFATRRAQLVSTRDAMAAEAATEAVEVSAADSTDVPALRAALRDAAGFDATPLHVLTRRLAELRAQLARTYVELGVSGLDSIRAARPLSATRIEQELERRREGSVLEQQHRADLERIASDIADVEARVMSLEAAGDIPTLEGLREARANREQAWAHLLAVGFAGTALGGDSRTKPEIPVADTSVPASSGGAIGAFEAAVAWTDQYADRLREDSARAADYAHAQTQLGHLGARHQAGLQQIARLKRERDSDLNHWMQTLTGAELPAIAEPELLRDWQRSRDDALALGNQLAEAEHEEARLREREARIGERLRSALGAHCPAGTDQTLESLIATATHVDQQFRDAEVKAAARTRQQETVSRDLNALDNDYRTATSTNETLRKAIAPHCVKLWLEPDAPVAVIRARLRECERGAALESRAAALDAANQLSAATIRRFERDAGQLESLTRGARTLSPEDTVSLLAERLAAAREIAQKKAESERLRIRLDRTHAEALETARRALEALAKLCEAAGADVADALPGIEQRVARKQEIEAELQRLERQLRAATEDDIAVLRSRLDGLSTEGLDGELQRLDEVIDSHKEALERARQNEEISRRALEKVDTSDEAAKAREDAEHAAASLARGADHWVRLRLAHALLKEAGRRFRERAQGPMMTGAGRYFKRMTNGRYVRLSAEEHQGEVRLIAERDDRRQLPVSAMSEGTADQLYLSLRLAALDLKAGARHGMPLVLDDILITSDDERACSVLRALSDFAASHQVLLFTHHAHVLELAERTLPAGAFAVQYLPPPYSD